MSDEQLAAKLQTADEADLQDAHRQIEQLRAELAAANARAGAVEEALAAVPVDELRRWYGHSEVGCAVSALRYEFDQAWRDKDAIDYWLNGNDDDGVPPAAAYVGLEVQP